MKDIYNVYHLFLSKDITTRSVHGAVTMVTLINKLHADSIVHYGVALCPPGTNFCKRKSIEVARKRIHIPEENSYYFPIFVGTANGAVVHNRYPLIKNEVLLNVLTNLYFKNTIFFDSNTWANKIVKQHLLDLYSKLED